MYVKFMINFPIIFCETVYEKREMVDKKNSDVSKSDLSRYHPNDLCTLTTEQIDELVEKSLKLYVSGYIIITKLSVQFCYLMECIGN